MFSGIVEEAGRIERFEEGADAWKLVVRASRVIQGLAQGDSIAVNGCCLTAVQFADDWMQFDLLGETVRLTALRDLKPGDPVNLETSLRHEGKIGGHFVSGHIDGTGEITVLEQRDKDFYLRIAPVDAAFMRYLVYKGSIAIDGISLTVAEVGEHDFACWLIPHTMEVTNLHHRKAGEIVNLEFDLLAKYVEKLLPGQRAIERSDAT